jgi:predicted amidohydrolase YtcJ
VILENANILTMDEGMPRASALAIAGGRVLGGVDSREDAIASHAHERVNLQGATVLPGFVDAHVHFRAWALSRVRVNLGRADEPVGDLDAALATVTAHAATLPADGWVLGGGWRDAVLPRDTDVGAALHQATGDRPAALVSKDGHGLWVSPAALAALEIRPEDLEAPGAVVERDEAGRFLGVLREEAAWAVRRRLPEADLTTATMAKAVREAARRGVTCVHDMDGASGLRSWRTLERERGLQLRVWQQLLGHDLQHASALGIDAGFGGDRLRIGAVKLFADGTLGSGTAWLHEPELAAPGTAPRQGVTITSLDALEEQARTAARAGLPLFIHAIGDAAVAAAVEALVRTHEHWGHLAVRPRIEHVQLADLPDLERCAQLGIALSVQPTHLVEDRDLADTHWGASRTPRTFAFRSMVDAGACVVLGSDAPIEDLDPLAALHAAVERDGGAHGLATARGAWHPEQRLDVDTALRACTSWPHDAMGDSQRLGRLVPGRAADLVVLDGDPYSTPIADLRVVATMVGGRWTHGASSF